MEAAEDEVLWRQVLSGHADVFGVIWDRHRDRVHAYLLRLGTPATDVEDLVATVFLELWRRRRSVRFVEASLTPWLLVTALIASRNARRAQARHRAFLARLPPAGVVADPADRVAARHDQTVVQVRTAIRDASPQDRHLVALTALGDCTIRQAAQALGISESAAKMRLSRLRSRVRHDIAAPTTVEEVAQ